MALELATLRPEHAEDYLAFFDRAFADNPAWSGCYCAFYEDPCPDAEWSPAASAGPAHRAARGAQIKSGKAHGVLALDRREIVGWCNAGPRSAFGNLRVFGSAVGDPREPVGAVMCFVIAPERRREGIATALLARAESLFRELGLSFAEAYPRALPPNPAVPASASYYKGSPAMYERAGYLPHRRFERFTCVRKRL
jgi:GNAT superfamily N-acetyltransferase